MRRCSPTTTPSLAPGDDRLPGRHPRQPVADGRSRPCSPSRSGIAAALYLEEFADRGPLVEPVHRGQPAEPRRGPVDRLRPARRRGDGPDRASATRASSSAAPIALALLILPVIIITTREAVRAVPARDPATARWRWAPRCGRPRGGRPCPRPSRASPPAPSWACPGRSARRRRCSCVGLAGSVRFDPEGVMSHDHGAADADLLADARSRRRNSRQAASAAIIVLLVMILGLNALAIFIRNKFQRSW